MRQLCHAFAVLAAHLLAAPLVSPSYGMDIPGQFSISESGAANYAVPIQVPPGTAGIEPKLALTYNSQSGNGLLGIGWSLSGLSAIGRCPRTMSQDGARGIVSFDTNDRFCLDGQRLVVISGSYGSAGSEYRVERGSFDKIVANGIANGSAANGPASFTVKTAAGLTMEYGATIEAQGKSIIRIWALNKISDAKGNYLTISYTKDSANGDFYPQRIDYTGNSVTGSTPANAVIFDYEARPDVVAMYQAGSLVRNIVRLNKVRTLTGTAQAVFSEYSLQFESSGFNSNSRLVGLLHCVGPDCLPRSDFSWLQSTSGISAAEKWVQHEGPYLIDQSHYVDVDGDGRSDLVFRGSDNRFWVSRSTGSGFTSPTLWVQHGGNYENAEALYSDVNGDGKSDLIFRGSDNRFWVSLSTGTSFSTPTVWIQHGGSYISGQGQLVDVDGDSRADLVFRGSDNRFNVSLSTGTGFSAPVVWTQHGGTYANAEALYAEVNGDGRADLIFRGSDNRFWVSLSTGSTFTTPAVWVQHGGAYVAGQGQLVDLNGDGLADLVFRGSDNRFNVSLSTGTGFTTSTVWLQHGGNYANAEALYADVNGDGRADLIFRGIDNRFWISLSTGTSFTEPAVWVEHGGSYFAGQGQLADANGDGRADLFFRGSDNAVHASLVTGNFDLLFKISPGTGSSTSVSYASLPSLLNTRYEKSLVPTFPQVALSPSLQVATDVDLSNGIGSTRRTRYSYGTAIAEVGTGRGFLGFEWTQSEDTGTGVVSRTWYRQDWPYTGQVSKVERGTSATNRSNLGVTTYTYDCTDFDTTPGCQNAPGKRYFPFVTRVDEKRWDLNGVALPVTRTDTVYDCGNASTVCFGNALDLTVSTLNPDGSPSGYSKRTQSQFYNDTNNWILGRLLRSSVTHTAP